MIKIQATSMTTGSKKWFIMSDEDYKKRYTHYPAWSFNDSTHTYIGQPMIEETLKAFNCG